MKRTVGTVRITSSVEAEGASGEVVNKLYCWRTAVRLPRFQLRTLMTLVAITAFLIWGGNTLIPWVRTMWSVSSSHRRLADFLHSHPRLDLENAKRHEARAQALMKPDSPQ